MSNSILVWPVVHIDWDEDGSFATSGDDITAYVKAMGGIKQGLEDILTNRVAAVGSCTLLVNNADRRFTPAYSGGPLFGKLLPDKPVRVQVTNGVTTWPLFRGFIQEIIPEPGRYKTRQAVIRCVDILSYIQDETINTPLQENIKADSLVRLVVNTALQAAVATATIPVTAQPANNNTAVFNGITYTWKTTLAGDDQVKIGTDIIDSVANLVAAINKAEGVGTKYSTNMTRIGVMTASANPNIRYDASNTDSDVLLRSTVGTTKDKLAMRILLGDPRTWQQVRLNLKKIGSPTGTMTVRIESDVDDHASGTLLHADATGMALESALSTSYGMTAFTFAGSGAVLPGNTKAWIVLETTRSASGTNYVAWGADGSSPSFADGEMKYYASSTWTQENKDACFDFGVDTVTLTSTIRGAAGNAYTVAVTGSWGTPSGATLSGGVDEPQSPTPVLETGQRTFEFAGDSWDTDQTNGLDALREICESERGVMYVDETGALTFRNLQWIFKKPAEASVLALDSEEAAVDAAISKEEVYRRVEVTFEPRSSVAFGVVAKATNVVTVPGQTGLTERWNSTQQIRQAAGDVVVKLPYIDTVGQPMGARNIRTPLEATTDWTANEAPDGTGVDYTGSARLTFSVAIVGSSIEVSVRNTAIAPLYLTKLQVRGELLVRYNPDKRIAEAPGSGKKRTLSLMLPLPSGDAFAQAVAEYELSRAQDEHYRVQSLAFLKVNKIGAVVLFDIQIGDVIEFSDYQLGIVNQKNLVIGKSYDNLGPGSVGDIKFNLSRLDDVTYAIYDDPVYGIYDSAETRYSL